MLAKANWYKVRETAHRARSPTAVQKLDRYFAKDACKRWRRLNLHTPTTKRIPHPHEIHGDVREDDYYWLRDREQADVIRYLEEENRYYEETMRPLEPLTDRLYEEMVARIPGQEIHVPVQDGPYYYYSRMDKQLQYAIYARKRATNRSELATAAEEITLDLNALAVDGGYLSVTVQRISPDHTRLAYLENRDGTDAYTAYVKDLASATLLPDRIEGVFIGASLEWDASGSYLFYVTIDESQRPYRVWRHRLGDTGADTLLYEESDITFSVRLGKSRSGRFLFINSESKTTSEVRYIDATAPLAEPQLFAARRAAIEYDLEHWGDDFLILTNEGAQNFRLKRCPISDTTQSRDLFAYDDARYLQAVYPFRDALLLAGRQDGLTQLWLYQDDTLRLLQWEEPVYTVTAHGNRGYDTTEIIVAFESLVTPRTTYALDLLTQARTCLQVAPVSGDYAPEEYVQERLWAKAEDGTQVPVIVVSRCDARTRGPAPLLLYAYGSYGANSDPHFDPMRLPLLDRGVIYAVAQIRGGSEMGRSWYEHGKLLHKRNTFTDFIAAARDLIARGYTTADQLAIRGGSAGGLLMGGVVNMAGELFAAVVANVPFVDVVTTMLDATIPLTSLEWDEWGNPEDPQYYAYMKSYSPYDNVEAKAYPHMLVTTGLNDPRVAYWEPAKWVARLRQVKTDDHLLLLKTNMGAGHFGASGRFNHLKEMAGMYAFMLHHIGVRN